MKITCTLLISLSFVVVSCQSQFCKGSKKYLKKVNTSRSYVVEGVYCISKLKIEYSKGCKVNFNVYDRVSGNLIENGMIFFSETDKFEIKSGKAVAKVPLGVYDVNIMSFSAKSLPFGIKKLELLQESAIEINCYVGSSVEF